MEFDKMAFMIDQRIDKWTKDMLKITPIQKSCVIRFVNSILKYISLYSKLP